MKLTTLLIAALALPLAAFAADNTVVTKLSGQARTANGEVALGNLIVQDDTLETNSESAVTVQLPNGGVITLGPGTRVIFKVISQGSDPGHYSYEITLLRGSISGDSGTSAGSSNFSIKTTAGVANVAGTSFDLTFIPATSTGGTEKVRSNAGVIDFQPTGSTDPIKVGPNKEVTVTPGSTVAPVVIDAVGTPTVAKSTPVTSNSTSGSTNGESNDANKGDKPKTLLPDFSLLVISPNGN